MGKSSAGLTSLSSMPQSVQSDIPTSFQDSDHKQELEGMVMELESQVRVKRKLREELLSEVDKLQVMKSEQTRQIQMEMRDLRNARDKLVKQVRVFAALYFSYKTGKERAIDAIADYSDKEFFSLTEYAKTINASLKAQQDKIDDNYAELSEEEDFVTGLTDYLTDFAQFCESTASSNATERLEIDKMVKDTAYLNQQSKNSSEEVKIRLDHAKNMENEAKILKSETLKSRKAAAVLEKRLSSEVSRRERDIKRLLGEISSKEKNFSTIKKRLEDRERRILDREEAFIRKEAEISKALQFYRKYRNKIA